MQALRYRNGLPNHGYWSLTDGVLGGANRGMLSTPTCVTELCIDEGPAGHSSTAQTTGNSLFADAGRSTISAVVLYKLKHSHSNVSAGSCIINKPRMNQHDVSERQPGASIETGSVQLLAVNKDYSIVRINS